MDDYLRIWLEVVVHPAPGEYSFLLRHGVQTSMYVQALICAPTTAMRRCFAATMTPGSYRAAFTEHTELAFQTDAVASAASFSISDVDAMTDVIDRIGFVALWNDASRGWALNDDDGSFLLKHTTKNFIRS
eukprot:4069214-Prymnesium_polylepis.2